MASGFSTKEAKELLTRLDSIQKQQQTLIGLPEKYRADAERLARGMVSYRAFENTVRDEVLRGKDNSGSIRGIDALIRDIAAYRRLLPIAQYCDKLSSPHQSEIRELRQSLSSCTGGLRRMFASSSQKQKAEQAYTALGSLLGSDYAVHTEQMTADAQQIERTSAAAAMQEWNQDRGTYYQAAAAALAKVQGGSIAEFDTLFRQFDSLLQPVRQAEQTMEQSREAVLSEKTDLHENR